MYYVKCFLKHNYSFYGEIALAAGLLFIIQGLGSFYLLKDTAGRAGFELFSDLSELTFILVLLFSLLYNSLHSFRIIQNCRLLNVEEGTEQVKYLLLNLFSLFALITTVTVSFISSDILRYLVSSFFATKDNFDRLSFLTVLQIPNFREYCLDGPIYVKMNLIGCLIMVCSILSLCGFMFKRRILIKTFMMLLFVCLAATGLIFSGIMNENLEKLIQGNGITSYYICFISELAISCIAFGVSNMLCKRNIL